MWCVKAFTLNQMSDISEFVHCWKQLDYVSTQLFNKKYNKGKALFFGRFNVKMLGVVNLIHHKEKPL